MAGASNVGGSAQQHTDPRQIPERTAERDIRPVVERPRRGLSNAAIGGLAIVAALGLFGVLEARRQQISAPATLLARSDRVESAAPAPLYVPPAPIPAPLTVAATPTLLAHRIDEPQRLGAPLPVSARIAPAPSYELSQPAIAPQRPPRNVGGQSFVVDTSGASPQATAVGEPEAAGKNSDNNKRPGLSTARARAAMLANRSTTVPQGTLIPAVLETAFDSTSPGFARALIQKDVHGFDGTRVLIPRGSRLIGEYGADTQRGQKRAIILWSRLIRPDGVTIEIGSPAADPVGRGGVKADVNTHFFERFSGAILQSAFDLGITLAARNSQSPVIVALPGAGARVSSPAPTSAGSNDITPTLRVPAARSVSVFVARDLDFTQAENLR